ncbi:DUF4235 domain-containing protein [Rothia santali]|nr:DUF4235 domain-containing protein [Rothia santali]
MNGHQSTPRFAGRESLGEPRGSPGRAARVVSSTRRPGAGHPPGPITEETHMSNPMIKIGSTVASLAGVALANKILTAGWKKVTGDEPPTVNDDPDEQIRDIIIWSLVTGLVGTLIKVGVSRAL